MHTATIATSLLQPSGVRRVLAQSLLAIVALALVTVACARLQSGEPQLTAAALVYLVIVALLSLNGSFGGAVVVSVIAVVLLQDLATPPLFSVSLNEPFDLVALAAFLITALVITRLVTRMRASLGSLGRSLEDLRRAEAAARQQAALLDLTHDTVFVRDSNDVITFWNRGAQELYGWSVAEAVGRMTHELLQPQFPVPFDEIMAELDRNGRWEGELTHARRDRSRVVVASRWSLQRDADARPLGILETNNDVTARKQAEDALLQAQTELARLSRLTALGELAASIAHEVNQPLTAIAADAQAALNWLAAEKPDLALVRATLFAIVKDSERAANVLARIRAMLSRSALPHQPCDLAEVARETLQLVQGEFARAAIQLQASLPGELPLVMGDSVQLQQVLLNLLMNAADASKEAVAERRAVTVMAAAERNERTYVVVRVRDSGVGIQDEDHSRLFEAFYSTKPGGLGMGLSVSRAIVERHGGKLWVTENRDQGATFHFSIPAQS